MCTSTRDRRRRSMTGARRTGLPRFSSSDDGDDVELRAFVHRVTRSLVAFEWDLVANVAFLQISQLPTGFDYADVADEFFEPLQPWLDRSKFTLVDLRQPIKALHELEESGPAKPARTESTTAPCRVGDSRGRAPAPPIRCWVSRRLMPL